MAAPPEAILGSRRDLPPPPAAPARKAEAEGGCGVIGIASSVALPGRHLLQALRQMRNRGNGKGGGIAAAGLDPAFFGVPPRVLADDYLLAVACLDEKVRSEVETRFVHPAFVVDHEAAIPQISGAAAALGIPVPPPEVRCYFVRVKDEVKAAFMRTNAIADPASAEDEIVYRNSYRLNLALYASTGEKRAFVLSHGKDLLVLKMVGHGDDVVRAYRLEALRAQIWIGHHRYPTKGRVWHPGGAHPFIGMHEALVHNGDFANYASICATLAQRGIRPLFLTDTEVAVLAFDLLSRTYGYPLEYVIEALAPTTERDFALLPEERRRVYRMLQAAHIHGSPDGPWFFLLAQSDPKDRARRLIGITDTSMLRPQVFALQRGEAAVGFAASEKQAIDAALESLAAEDPRFWSRADLYWNARGGSHTDGGSFTFTVRPDGASGASLVCEDKFGRRIEPAAPPSRPARPAGPPASRAAEPAVPPSFEAEPEAVFEALRARLPSWDGAHLAEALGGLVRSATDDDGRLKTLAVLTRLMDRRYPTGPLPRSRVLSLLDAALLRLVESMRDGNGTGGGNGGGRRCVCVGPDGPAPAPEAPDATAVVDARGYPAEGPGSLARAVVDLHARGFRRIAIVGARGQRFLGCGLGVLSRGLSLDVYGSPGDYLASGIDGAAIAVHGSAQDQLAQIMKDGFLVVHGDVGQTFMYGAKGGQAFVLGNAAGRPLINAVGRPRVVINGTCLDYLAESFMAGDPLNGGGFAVLNGVALQDDGSLRDLESPYPGGNLFSLASGGALYVRDPKGLLGEDQLNGGEFAPLAPEDWAAIRPSLEENERLFSIPVRALLEVDGRALDPSRVYRKIRPAGHQALLPEEAWTRPEP